MPLKVTLENGVFDWIYPESDWKELDLSIWKKDFQIANHLFMIDVKKALIVFVDNNSLIKFAIQ